MKNVRIESLAGHVYAVQASNGRHMLVADEPVSDGGEDTGPSPYELLLAGLGACMAITLRMYANHKQWPVESVSIELSHDRILATDCETCTPEERAAAGPGGRIDVIHTDIKVVGHLDEEQVKRLHEIAGRCPVHRSLEAPPKFVSTITASM